MPGQDRWVDYAVVCGASLFVIAGGLLVAMGVRNIWRAIASEQWPKTTAVVADSATSDVEFHYTVGGANFSTSLRHFGQLDSNDSAEAQLIRYRYPPNATVSISYSTHSPWIAAAEPGLTSDALWIPGAGLAFAVPGIMFIVLWFAMSRGNNRGFGIGLGMFACIFATLGLIFLVNGLLNLWRSYESPHWPQAKGIIVCGRVDRNQKFSTEAEANPEFTVSTGTHFVYRYDVAGHAYFSNIRRFGQTDDSSMQNDALYPLGRELPVTYSPVNPSLSTIETGIANENYWIPGAGAAFFFFGLAVLIFGIPALTR